MQDPLCPATHSISRRALLRYVGFGAAALTTRSLLGPLAASASQTRSVPGAWADALGVLGFRPVDYPLPHPGDGGDAASDPARFAEFEVRDDLVLPEGFRFDVVASWGDRFGPADEPAKQIRFGFNADYTGLVPVAGTRDEFFLIVNHEYISATPWLEGWRDVFGDEPPVDENGRITDAKRVAERGIADMGVSILRVRRGADGRVAVINDSSDHFRIAGDGVENVPAPAMRFSGPAATLLGTPRGTISNCSGATTPWGTFLSCEENFQDYVPPFIRADGSVMDDPPMRFDAVEGMGLPFEFNGLGTLLDPPLDGRQYGWTVEIDPVARSMTKHSALGRFRHENVALRVETDRKLAAYEGDDRRGGHVWKFVSRVTVREPKSPTNSRLLEDGTLHVARFNADFSGTWIPLVPRTPLRRPEPEHCALGFAWLPNLESGGHVVVRAADPKPGEMTIEQWVASVERFTGKPFGDCTLGDLVRRPQGVTLDDDAWKRHQQAVLLMDAYAYANAVGGTPTSRPEDIEVHPGDASVYIAFTDSTGSDDGSPDVRIFPDSRGENSRQYGAIYRIEEHESDPAATSFTWGKFVAAGEAADGGGGFACCDNLAFDPAGNLWMVTDITTPAHNFPVNREDKTAPGGSRFPGVFGNNALFCIPTRGPDAGVPHCFAVGPMECEMTGPTFTDDGRTLVLSIQHPGELYGARGRNPRRATEVVRTMKLAARDGTIFTQKRTVPLGSNFPSKRPGDAPKPCVVCITRAT